MEKANEAEKEYSVEEIRYRLLLEKFRGFPVSMRMAVRTVGGAGRLNKLMEQGLITYIEEPGLNDAPQRKRKINFGQCLMYVSPRLLKKI